MNNVQFVNILNSCDDLMEKLAGFLFFDPENLKNLIRLLGVSDNKVEQLASTCELSDQEELLGRLDDLGGL